MMNQLMTLSTLIDGRSYRERIMILATAVLTPLVILDAAFLKDHNENYEQIIRRTGQTQKQVLDLKIAEKNILISHAKDPDKDAEKQVAELEVQLATLQKRLGDVGAHLIPVGKSADVVKDLLALPEGLQLTQVTTKPSRPYVSSNANEGENTTNMIYVHTLQIDFNGGFQTMLGYLKHLETLPWKVQWKSIQVKSEAYPKIEVSLTVDLLSVEKVLIGV